MPRGEHQASGGNPRPFMDRVRPDQPFRERIDFDRINDAARAVLPALCNRWLPDGTQRGKEWVARNPTRSDGRPGSFSINLTTGRWSDFATGDKGGDPVSLAAYLFHGRDQIAAAKAVRQMLGL